MRNFLKKTSDYSLHNFLTSFETAGSGKGPNYSEKKGCYFLTALSILLKSLDRNAE
jgi:hypothetical protein